jgi:hypothetical protein
MRDCFERCRRRVRPFSLRRPLRLLLVLTPLAITTGCTGLGGPPPTPVVVVITATPGPQSAPTTPAAPPVPTAASAGKPAATAAPVSAGKPSAGAAATPAPKVARAAPSPTPTPAAQALTVGRTNSYRGLLFTVEEARSGKTIEAQSARGNRTLVGLRTKVHNPGGLLVHFANTGLTRLVRLQLPDGAQVQAEDEDPFIRPQIQPQDSVSGWLFFEVDRPVPLESLVLALGGSQETAVTLPFSGPEPKVARRTFEYLRSTEPVRGLIWSVSGGELRLDVPGQQANPGQEFIVVNVRATNPSTAAVTLRGRGSVLQDAKDYLRIRADNGVLLQVSAELSPLPNEFPPKAEQDTLYAWQLPIGSKNPKLVILSPDGSEHELELGPLPPP